MLIGSWTGITNQTIRKCFRYAGFHVPGDHSKNSDECNEAIAGVAKVQSKRSKFPEVVDESTVDKFVSAGDDVVSMGELENEDYIATILLSTSKSEHNDQSKEYPLPTSSEVIGLSQLVLHFSTNVEGCGLTYSDSLNHV
ncbi:hypothetical protein HPB51_022363 [Rhipicephalus microplus]|uniref:Uncharacterized protein n=1 Tax=Rhipicephalus microplus TaxID=6941 RepID=A0A9J6DQ91_RHIMP|nr:hypothetical protein HPB51_022363 [Rhipicephalus microplus]